MPEAPNGSAAVTWADVLALVAQLDRSGLQDAEIESAGVRVRVSRTVLGPAQPSSAAAPAPVVPAEESPSDTTAPTARTTAGGPEITAGGPEITAPMLGVVYHRPSPDEAPFVAVGDSVTPDTTVAILEVMKLMNPVTAGVVGTIAEVCAVEGQMVEFGDVLFRLEITP